MLTWWMEKGASVGSADTPCPVLSLPHLACTLWVCLCPPGVTAFVQGGGMGLVPVLSFLSSFEYSRTRLDIGFSSSQGVSNTVNEFAVL